ncbi:hypothetical protein R1sor_026593 [Riccia sorocarpa]|uniref:Peroxygenase 3 n=1 Tax=Riccia sorocarpa TaxID=122646 RepID=A0ABD3GF42_9MARC
MARALEAVDSEHPEGTPGYDNKGYSVLQQHVQFFDRNHDGIIYPWEIYAGLRAVGFNVVLSFISAISINLALSYVTLPVPTFFARAFKTSLFPIMNNTAALSADSIALLPNPIFPIYISKIHKGKHGSDTGVYDTEGRFVPNKFEELWTKFSNTHLQKLTFKELMGMIDALRVAWDPFGWFANKSEWILTYLLAKDEEGLIHKESVRGVYDGSFFYQVENARKKKALAKQKFKM